MDPLSRLRIACYARFSSDNQKDTSIDDQVRLCRDYVASNRGEVPEHLVFGDNAISGAVKDRPAFEHLIRLVESRGVDVIVTESADRLSRDLGDADRLWKLIDYHGVRLICVSDGIDSVSEGARMQFRFKAVFADEYLVDLGKKTRRGQEGAAARGHSTGGLPYGYTSQAIWNGGREPEGFKILIDAGRAETVLRIFEMYNSGLSYLSIASTLNSEGVPPPRASAKSASRFWKKGTVRAILDNRAYIGEWAYGRKLWRKDPVTRKRRYSRRPESEVKRHDRPHLRIIPQELWDLVETRRKQVSENYSGRDHGAPGRRTSHPFSGLLYCGVCGHRMTDGGGSSARYYKCSGAVSGGFCDNRMPLREDVLVNAAVAELRRILLHSDLYERLRTQVETRLKTFRVHVEDEQRRLENVSRRLDGEVERLIMFIRSTDLDPSADAHAQLRKSLDEVTKEQRAVRDKLNSVRQQAKSPPRLPTVDEILERAIDVEARIKDDPTTAREAIRRMLFDGKIVMHPQPDGSYKAESSIFPLRLPKSRKPRNQKVSEASRDVVGNDSCAGRI